MIRDHSKYVFRKQDHLESWDFLHCVHKPKRRLRTVPILQWYFGKKILDIFWNTFNPAKHIEFLKNAGNLYYIMKYWEKKSPKYGEKNFKFNYHWSVKHI